MKKNLKMVLSGKLGEKEDLRTWSYLYQAKPWSSLKEDEKKWLLKVTQGAEDVMLWGHELEENDSVDESSTFYVAKKQLPETEFFTYCGYFKKSPDEENAGSIPVAHA